MSVGYAKLVRKIQPNPGFIVGIVVGEKICDMDWCQYLVHDLEQVEPIYDMLTLAYKRKVIQRETRLGLLLEDYKDLLDFDLGVLLPYAVRNEGFD